MQSSAKVSQLSPAIARQLVAAALSGEKPAIRRLQAALGRAGKPIWPEPLVVTIRLFDFPDQDGSADGSSGAHSSATGQGPPRR
jgi:hypothetical protein